MLIRNWFPYQAEEDGEGGSSSGGDNSTDRSSTPPGLDEAKIAEMIKSNVTASMKEVIEGLPQTRQNDSQQTQQAPDLWDTIINDKVSPKLGQISLRAESAEDRAEFYSSDFWLEEVDEFLIEDDPVKRKAEKQAIKAEVERLFKLQVDKGRGMPRSDIADAVLGQKLKKDRIAYQEATVNRNKKRSELDLDKARRAVDINSGNISNFSPENVHKMSWEKVVEQHGNLTF